MCGIDYFLDLMQDYEISTIIDCLPFLDRVSWEQNRFSVYSNIQMNTKKKIEPTDVLRFAWDKDTEEPNTSITNEEIQRLQEKSKLIFNSINNG